MGCRQGYRENHHILIRVVGSTYELESKTRKRWPIYALHEEDLVMRKHKWNEKYGRGQRIVVWDMINIGCFGFSESDL